MIVGWHEKVDEVVRELKQRGRGWTSTTGLDIIHIFHVFWPLCLIFFFLTTVDFVPPIVSTVLILASNYVDFYVEQNHPPQSHMQNTPGLLIL